MKFDTIEIDDRFIEEVKVWSKESSQVIEHCLSNNIWIAGGFARKLYEIYVLKNKLDISLQNYFFLCGGDIDMFGNKEDLKYSAKYFENFSSENEDNFILTYHKNLYTENLTFFCDNILYKKELLSVARRTGIVLQLVNKLSHKNIFDCFESFDLTNSKYGVYKKENKIFLIFDKEACYYDSRKELDISHSNTPYLAQRIIKYIKKKSLNKISSRSREKIKSYLINVISNKWAENIHELTISDVSQVHRDIIKLNNIINLSDEEVIIMLGKIKLLKSNDDYSSFVSKDWASEMIKGER